MLRRDQRRNHRAVEVTGLEGAKRGALPVFDAVVTPLRDNITGPPITARLQLRHGRDHKAIVIRADGVQLRPFDQIIGVDAREAIPGET